jgi:hypothetical protein
MKRRIIALSIGLLVFILASALFAAAADDYKVIKNAVNHSGSTAADQKSMQWFKIVVTDKSGKEENVKISLPIAVVELMVNSCSKEKFKVENDCQIDLKKIWNELKKAGPLALVEIEDHDETVKIWLE